MSVRDERGSRLALWVGAAMLLGAVVVGWTAGGVPDELGTRHAGQAAEGRARSDVRAAGPAGSSRIDGTVPAVDASSGRLDESAGPYLRPGDGYREIMARLGPASEDDPIALFVVGEAVSVCTRAGRPDAARRARSDGARAFIAWRADFCRGEFAGEERRDEVLRKRMAGVASRHPEWRGVDSPGGAPIFDAVLSGTSVDEVQMAISLLSIGEPWEFGEDLVEGTGLAPNLSRYQEIALESLMCDVTGGCGPNGLRTAMLCLHAPEPTCHPERSLYDAWNDRFAPEELAVIAGVRERIVAERQRRATHREDGSSPM
ncbi:hypothetical protein [Luteibacter sp. 329MFSha]|uniref:hypothetical protein n=1 Tax=Luteibacter sp. 329MFSha TaxID=1798239 RepID=UPI0008BA939E|nr:hypothetical protein [Luteibacter sp. 329MFSha]SEV88476.1 hypothetical protein SAMN04515660_0630 [Luteibacter sp. 329MFSha]